MDRETLTGIYEKFHAVYERIEALETQNAALRSRLDALETAHKMAEPSHDIPARRSVSMMTSEEVRGLPAEPRRSVSATMQNDVQNLALELPVATFADFDALLALKRENTVKMLGADGQVHIVNEHGVARCGATNLVPFFRRDAQRCATCFDSGMA